MIFIKQFFEQPQKQFSLSNFSGRPRLSEQTGPKINYFNIIIAVYQNIPIMQIAMIDAV